LMKSLRIPATSGLCGVSTKTSNQTFQYRCLNSSSRQKHYPPLKPTMPFPLKRAATNPNVAFDQIYKYLIVIVPPHTVLDETYLALDEIEHDVLDPCLRHLLRRS
jgi:hypothetical protein